MLRHRLPETQLDIWQKIKGFLLKTGQVRHKLLRVYNQLQYITKRNDLQLRNCKIMLEK